MNYWPENVCDYIKLDVPSFRHVQLSVPSLPMGEWFYCEITPISIDKEQVRNILCDLVNLRDVQYIIGRNGRVLHDEDCRYQDHSLPVQDMEIAEKIEQRTYKMVIWEGFHGDCQAPHLNYPIFTPLEPEINHFKYGWHPHLNQCVNTPKFCLPESLCYEIDYASLGKDKASQVINAFDIICVWLFRHQVWELRSGNPLTRWPGKEIPTEEKTVTDAAKLFHKNIILHDALMASLRNEFLYKSKRGR